MRILVPVFAAVVTFGLINTANATVPLGTALGKVSCGGEYQPEVPGNAADSTSNKICEYTAFNVCQHPIIDRGSCNAYKFPSARPSTASRQQLEITWPTNKMSAQQLESIADRLSRPAAEYYRMAQVCCTAASAGGHSCIAQLPPEARAADAKAKAATPGGGLNESQTKTGDLTRDGYLANAGYAGVCNANRAICQEQYEALLRNYRGDTVCLENDMLCKGVAQEIENKFKSQQSACAGFDLAAARTQAQSFFGNSQDAFAGGKKTSGTQPQSVGDNGGSGGNGTKETGSGNGQLGNMLKSMLPMAMQMLQGQGEEQPQDFTGQQLDCSAMDANGVPIMAGCMANKATSFNPESSSSNYSNQSAGDTGTNFGIGDTSGTQNGQASATGIKPADVTTGTVANGGGGMAGGGGGAGAQLGGNGQPAGPGGPKTNTDILRGEGGGGGGGLGAMNAGMAMSTGQTGGSGGNYGQQGGSEFENMRLADYLPKFDGGPNRGLAGLAGGAGGGMQIQSKSTNIWNKVSDVIRSRCADGRLRDCGGR